jgi:predicted metal-dependent phosphoesterase TrpH
VTNLMAIETPHLRADLHVHSCHSTQSGNLAFLNTRDCYSDPLDIYRAAKSRGMDLVTITDHDSINGCLELLSRLPGADDVIMGEEVSCRFPGSSDIEVHLGVYGITEALHRDIQPLRNNVLDVVARLREAGVFFALNHLLHFYRGQLPLESYLRLLSEVPALEARNGTMVPAHNVLVERMVQHLRSSENDVGGWPAMIGGSDAHTLRRIGWTWTEAPGSTREGFLNAISRGLGRVGGAHGGVLAVSGDAYGVIVSYYASLLGVARSDHQGLHRAQCLAFSCAALPVQFLPWVIVAARKWSENATVARVAVALQPWLEGTAAEAGWLKVSEERT